MADRHDLPPQAKGDGCWHRRRNGARWIKRPMASTRAWWRYGSHGKRQKTLCGWRSSTARQLVHTGLLAYTLHFGRGKTLDTSFQRWLPEKPVGQLRAGIDERGINDNRNQAVRHACCKLTSQCTRAETQNERW